VDQAAPGSARLKAIWRYPVKSLQGEQLDDTVIDADGLRGDRYWGVRDDATGRILTARREPRLLLAGAALAADGQPDITLPIGGRLRGVGPSTDAALSAWLGKPVTLVAASSAPAGIAEQFVDATDDTSRAVEWAMPPGRFVDLMPLLVLTTASLRAGAAVHPDGDWDTRRFRPNLVVDVDASGWVEDAWCGKTLRIGAVELVPRQACVRCTLVTRPQPGLRRDLDVYKALSRHHEGTLGVWSEVQIPGPIHAGASVGLFP
jgi:uncharacterized protein YcbX